MADTHRVGKDPAGKLSLALELLSWLGLLSSAWSQAWDPPGPPDSVMPPAFEVRPSALASLTPASPAEEPESSVIHSHWVLPFSKYLFFPSCFKFLLHPT